MLIRCINRPFQDLAENTWREVGDEWEGTPERVAEINSAGYGVMAEAVETPAEVVAEAPAEAVEPPEEPPETAPETRAATTRAKGAAARRKPRKSAQEG